MDINQCIYFNLNLLLPTHLNGVLKENNMDLYYVGW